MYYLIICQAETLKMNRNRWTESVTGLLRNLHQTKNTNRLQERVVFFKNIKVPHLFLPFSVEDINL